MRRRIDTGDKVGIAATVVILAVLGFIVWSYTTSMPTLASGICVDKSYTAPNVDVVSYSVGQHVYTRTISYPPIYTVQVSGTTDDGEPRTEWWSVSGVMYAQIQIGDYLEQLPSGSVRIAGKATQ